MRQAYRDRARRHHPDHQEGRSAPERRQAAVAMGQLNEAWRVLRDPAARGAYDAGLRRPSSAPLPGARPSPAWTQDEDADLAAVAPTAGPWATLVRSGPWLLLLAVLAAIFVFTAYAAGDREPAPAGSSQEAVECVRLDAGAPTAVACAVPGARPVRHQPEAGRSCPAGSYGVHLVDDRLVCLEG